MALPLLVSAPMMTTTRTASSQSRLFAWMIRSVHEIPLLLLSPSSFLFMSFSHEEKIFSLFLGLSLSMCVMCSSWELISCRLIHTSRATEHGSFVLDFFVFRADEKFSSMRLPKANREAKFTDIDLDKHRRKRLDPLLRLLR